jgi:hypothetical protein
MIILLRKKPGLITLAFQFLLGRSGWNQILRESVSPPNLKGIFLPINFLFFGEWKAWT